MFQQHRPVRTQPLVASEAMIEVVVKVEASVEEPAPTTVFEFDPAKIV